MGIRTALDAVERAPRIIDAMRLSDDLAFEAGRDPGVRTLRVLASAIASADDVTVIAAVHALAEVYDEAAAQLLVSLLSDPRPFVREHATSALAHAPARPDALSRLIGAVIAGGFTGMLAQRTIEKWSASSGTLVTVAIESALFGITDATARAALVETLGLVRTPIAERALIEIAEDAAEPRVVRWAAIGALGQRPGARVERVVHALRADPAVADVAHLAAHDLAPAPAAALSAEPSADGLTVAQLFLHADIDPSLTTAGAGDNGGIATLLVRLGDALTARDDVARTLTMSRGTIADALADLDRLPADATGHRYGRIPLLVGPRPAADAWPSRIAARRGIRRLLRSAGAVDLLHLRMADVGSLAAMDVARELGIPVVFTVAPDPHSVIASLDAAGVLRRQGFGDVDLREHYWFRTRLVREIASNAAHTVLFPRPALESDMRELVGIDVRDHPERHTIVAEGVDIAVADDAVATVARGEASPAIDALVAELSALPPARRGLPLLVTVGRLHRVKGMATLVECWARSDLRDRANLVVIGGDLATPSADEREQLAIIDAILPPDERAEAGLVLAGHRPNDVAAQWIAAARLGLPGWVAPHGVYVCASLKEEFGLALLEALATGLLVVAPNAGGPATYVEHGVTGILTATSNLDALRAAIGDALDLAPANADDRAARAHAMVAERFTIQGMAATLAPVYARVVADDRALARAAEALA